MKKRKPGASAGPSIRTTASVPRETYRILESLAAQKKVSVAWVIRDAIERYVSDQWPLFGQKP
jgi:predicted DNA-binding protein